MEPPDFNEFTREAAAIRRLRRAMLGTPTHAGRTPEVRRDTG
jgi:hypothetical protein